MKIHKEMFDRWKKFCHLLCHDRGIPVWAVTSPTQAWNIAHALEIPKEAYHVDHSINDRHIETALRKIFPDAFKGVDG
jgi:hypothetical protein